MFGVRGWQRLDTSKGFTSPVSPIVLAPLAFRLADVTDTNRVHKAELQRRKQNLGGRKGAKRQIKNSQRLRAAGRN